jgi:hypothetical protein
MGPGIKTLNTTHKRQNYNSMQQSNEISLSSVHVDMSEKRIGGNNEINFTNKKKRRKA